MDDELDNTLEDLPVGPMDRDDEPPFSPAHRQSMQEETQPSNDTDVQPEELYEGDDDEQDLPEAERRIG